MHTFLYAQPLLGTQMLTTNVKTADRQKIRVQELITATQPCQQSALHTINHGRHCGLPAEMQPVRTQCRSTGLCTNPIRHNCWRVCRR